MFLMYFVIASINAVLTYKIREVERKERDEEEKLKTIKLYSTLLNSLSHELRTPISTIIGALVGLVALIIGISSYSRIIKNGNKIKGKGLALTGIILGSISLLLALVLVVILLI